MNQVSIFSIYFNLMNDFNNFNNPKFHNLQILSISKNINERAQNKINIQATPFI